MSSIRNFAGRVTPELLRDLLNRHRVSINDTQLAGTPTSIAAAIDRELDGRLGGRAALQHDIETVERLATEAGERAIESVAGNDILPTLPSREARALWLFLNDGQGFHWAEASIHHDAHRYSSRQWSPYSGPKGCDMRRDREAQEEFKASLRVLFDTSNVHLDIFDRSRSRFFDGGGGTDFADEKVSLVQITIYREDRPNIEPAFVDSEFTYQKRSRVIEAAVTYEPASGRIECVATRRGDREEVVRHFSTAMLGVDPDFEPIVMRSYDLSVLADRIHFPADPADNIEAVSVSMLRLVPNDGSSQRITLERTFEDPRDIWEMAELRLGKHSLATDYWIRQARIAIRHRPAGINRSQMLHVTITHPYRSDIKDQREIERLVASKYLPRWGLVVGQ